MNRNCVRLSRLSLALVAALAVAPAFAQSTSAGVGGVVTDAGGQPVAGAEVTILHVESGTVSRVTTDASGRYNARGLRVGGPYTITVNQGGRTDTEDNIYLSLDQVPQVNMNLAAATLDTVMVTASGFSQVFMPSNMGAGTSVTSEEIDRLPSIGRNIQDYIRLDPRIAQTDKGRGEISAGGQNTRYNNIRIDGVTINDGFGLEANNLTTNRQPVSLDAIEAINVSLSNYDVTQSGYTGANVDAVTKSGTNKFSGSVYGLYRDADWARKDVPGSSFTPAEEQTWGLTFGGPLIKDRLFFFAAYENFERTLGNPNPPSRINQQQIDAVRAAAQGHGIDVGDFNLPGTLKLNVEDYMARLDWNISDNHRAYLRYNRTKQTEPFLRSIGSSSLSLSSYWQTNNKLAESAVVQLFSDWTDNFSTEFKIGRSNTSSLWDLNSQLPQIRLCWGEGINVNSCGGTSIYAGAEQFRHVNILETEITNFYGAGTLFAGDHEIKFGAEYQRNDALNLFGRDAFGVYNFGGATFDEALANFAAGTPTRYSVRYPINGDINSLAAQIRLNTWGLFLQDTWMVTPNLTLTYGLRYDLPEVPNSPPANPTASALFGYDNTNTIDGNGLLQPRFGFNYTFESERPTQLRGGVGLFSGAAGNVWLANPYQNNGGVTLGEVFVGNGNGIAFNPDINNQPRIPGCVAQGNCTFSAGGPLDMVDGELKQPAVWKANLAIDHELPWWGIVGSAELLLTKVKNGLYYEALNLGEPSFRSPQDGRLLYWANPYTLSGSRGNRNTDYTDVTVLRPTSKGGGQQLTVSLSKPRVDQWSWGVAYTYTAATEVNPLTSSQAMSSWARGNAIVNPNENISANSLFAIRDRFTANLGWERKLFGDYRTSVAMFYEGRSGRPYSYTFRNDANGDGRSEANDLFYMPSGPGDVLFTGGAEMERAFWEYVAQNPGLLRYRGGNAKRNGERMPWVNNFDVRISQELPGFMSGHKSEIWLDIMNVGNLINKDWGQIEEIGFPFYRRVATLAGVDPATGKYIYNFDPNQADSPNLYDSSGQSRWALQIGFRYKF